MTHDPMCAISSTRCGGRDMKHHSLWSEPPAECEKCGAECDCDLIAKVRADTLNQAREAVVAVPWQSSMLGATVMRVDVVAAVDSLVAEATPVQGTKAG